MAKADGLEHAPQAMAKVQTQKAHSEDVPGRNPPYLESGNYILIDVTLDEGRTRVDVTGCELKEMEDDEGQDDGAAPVHGAGGIGRVDGLAARVADRPGCLAAERKLNGCSDMQGNGQEHDAAFEPQEFAEIVEEVTVGVDVLGGLEHLEVAEHMADDEAEHHDTGDGHDDFLAVGGLPKGNGLSEMRGYFGGAHQFVPALRFGGEFDNLALFRVTQRRV